VACERVKKKYLALFECEDKFTNYAGLINIYLLTYSIEQSPS